MRLLIVSHVVHYLHQGRIYAYGPYAREIELWADLFEQVVIASPCRREPPPGDALPFEAANIRMAPQHEGGGETFWAKLQMALWTPLIVLQLARQMWGSDAIHVRLSGNLGLLGALMAPLFSSRLVAKYAGAWCEMPGEEFTYRFQKAVLRSRWFRGPVTVYGEWPDQPPHVVPFFPSLLTEQQLERGRLAASRREPASQLRVIYTGRLSRQKNVATLLKAAAQCRRQGHEVECTVAGDGAELERLRSLAASLNIAGAVRFTGGVSFDRVMDLLEESDVLVLASDSEGFGKSLVEAMAFGVIPIASKGGIGPQIVENRGFAVTPGDVEELTQALIEICQSPDRCRRYRENGLEWSQQFSLEALHGAIKRLLEEHWNVCLGPTDKAPVQETAWDA